MKIRTTIGAELELANVDTKIKIPSSKGMWDFKDGSIANSNGSANDPLKKLNRYGGEVNTAVESNADDLAETTRKIYKRLRVDEDSFNYTTNLHVHVGVRGLIHDVRKLKRIAKYIHDQEDYLYHRVDELPPEPTRKQYTMDDAYEGAMKRHKRRKRSHQYRVPENRYERMMEAKTSDQFRDAHLSFSAAGAPQWHLLTRAGVNMASLWKHNTIELRFFTCSPDLQLMHNAYTFARILIMDALDEQHGIRNIIKDFKLKFQPYFDYDFDIDNIFQQTNVYHLSRKQVRENYEKFIDAGMFTKEDLGWE